MTPCPGRHDRPVPPTGMFTDDFTGEYPLKVEVRLCSSLLTMASVNVSRDTLSWIFLMDDPRGWTGRCVPGGMVSAIQ